ncbi:hypothetical protein QTP70_022939 [Hemibagrus guttatus]|uniref:ribonuclease H n=1 Tax=Hemibagrus guttatus TaxID=175788 RepID=A0AAE0UJF9_9TELE|nr:hypothetical protein QTP70_022939 [Hemibagrus guttatus]
MRVGGQVLPQVEEFKYLGVLFTSEGRMDREIDRWIGAAAAVMQSMYRSVVVKKELSRKAKLSIYQSIYVPTLTYGHELWVMIERVRSRIQAAKMIFLRRVAGRSLRDRVRSSVTREELGVEPLLLHIERGQLRWLGHLFRMPPGCLPGEVFRACPTGKRPRGRPRTCWRDYVSRLAWERLGVPPEELEEVSGERKEVIKRKSKKRIVDGVYEILDQVKNKGGEYVKRFWRCVFQDHIQQKYPVFRFLQNSLKDAPTLLQRSSTTTRNLTQNLCLYCGAPGHVISACPIRPPRPMVSTIFSSIQKMKSLTTIGNLTAADVSIPVAALLNSGSAGNFISGALCRQLKLKTTATSTTYQIQSITGKSVSRRQVSRCVGPLLLQIGVLHVEKISLLVLEESTADVILGCPWLEQHNPILSWKTSDVLKWGDTCFNDCFSEFPVPRSPSPNHLSVWATSIKSPLEKRSVDIPACYTPFSDVFCPKRASKLPPHRPWDCAINLLPGESVPRGKIYPLSILDEKAMEEYIEEALAQGYIRPSTSPAAPSFFFVAKKDGGLRPCIDYRALNHITVKFMYPLPLVPAALEHLRGATIFTKLDLRSAYNLIRIREGDEWKTAFVTPTGHYEYLVMPYGLVNAPSIFQDFIHEVLQEFLHKFVLVYIDDILIYYRNLAEHRHHVAEVLKRLREFQLFLKAEKCCFHQPSVQFLGYNIDSSGIRMDEGKNYSSISNPLTSLLRNKPKSLSWTTSAEEAFNTLKEAFTTAPLLVHPDPDKPFIMEVDASTTGVGVVLSQQQGNPSRLHPCAFFSRKLKPAEARWALFFTCFNFTISYRPGSKNTKADALSQLFTPEENTEEPETILPERGLPTAMETAELMFNHIFRYFGIPEYIVSDRGPQFISREVIKRKSKKRIVDGVYEILDQVENKGGEYVKRFWRCVFQYHIQQKYPVFRFLQNSLKDDSFRNCVKDGERDGKQHEQKEGATKRKRGDEEINEEEPGPSSGSIQKEPAKEPTL